jgi:myo-inositol-1(or 4)-monophosphatase
VSLDLIESLLRRGGDTLLTAKGHNKVLFSKRTLSDIVTEADYVSEKAILEALQAAAPDDGWLTEESGYRHGSTRRVWVIDPLDGTVNFATGVDDFGVILGLCEDGRPVAGGMYLPALGLMYLAERGGGATRNGTLIHASDTTEISEAVFDHSLSSIATSPADQERTLRALIKAARGVRCVHGLTYLGRVAEGTYDGFVYHSVGIWDLCGPSVILEEAGAELAQINGQPLDLRPTREAGTRIYAAMGANPILLQKLRTTIA